VIWAAEEIRLWADFAGSAADLGRQMQAGLGTPFGEPCPLQRSAIPGVGAASVCGGSPLWNALYDAARLKLREIAGNKALLILTDGFDTGSTHTWRQAADEAHRAEATVYAIQYPSALGGIYAPDLYRLVAETGGASFAGPKADFDAIVSRMESDLRRRYVLGFRPEKLSGKLRHEVQVEVARPDLTVRARKVYFEPAR
jgi:VWFA-related protein